ncbi:hypothetical protein [Methylovulum miyakonense]|nr:hypothetical protein [Methylovulum miyakonense]
MGIITVARVRGVVRQTLPDGTTCEIEDKTDWARLEAMTDEEIEAVVFDE